MWAQIQTDVAMKVGRLSVPMTTRLWQLSVLKIHGDAASLHAERDIVSFVSPTRDYEKHPKSFRIESWTGLRSG